MLKSLTNLHTSMNFIYASNTNDPNCVDRTPGIASLTTKMSSQPVCKDEVVGSDCTATAGPDDGIFDEAMTMLQQMSLDDIASAQQELAQVMAPACPGKKRANEHQARVLCPSALSDTASPT